MTDAECALKMFRDFAERVDRFDNPEYITLPSEDFFRDPIISTRENSQLQIDQVFLVRLVK